MISLDLNPTQVADLIITKLKLVMYDDPGARVMFATWERALRDAYLPKPGLPSGNTDDPKYRTALTSVVNRRNMIKDAKAFVTPVPACLELSGISPEYAERVIRSVEHHLPEHRRIYK